jgi:hypothetical protein
MEDSYSWLIMERQLMLKEEVPFIDPRYESRGLVVYRFVDRYSPVFRKMHEGSSRPLIDTITVTGLTNGYRWSERFRFCTVIHIERWGIESGTTEEYVPPSVWKKLPLVMKAIEYELVVFNYQILETVYRSTSQVR